VLEPRTAAFSGGLAPDRQDAEVPPPTGIRACMLCARLRVHRALLGEILLRLRARREHRLCFSLVASQQFASLLTGKKGRGIGMGRRDKARGG
jgi:CRISPR/Cas system endoribonuclease Cas6 (RAMP superfamily)